MKPFDERLFTLKLRELSNRMQHEVAERLRKADSDHRKLGQGRGTGWLVNRADAALGVFLERHVPDIDKACRETWLSDHDSITHDFIRGVLVPHVFTILAARKGAIQGDMELVARRVGIAVTSLTPALHHLVHATDRLRDTLATRYEIEAIEIGKRALPGPAIPTPSLVKAATSSTGRPASKTNRELQEPMPKADLWRDFHEKFHTLADEERREGAAPRDCFLRGYCDYTKHPEVWAEKGKPEQGLFCLLKPPNTGLWRISDGVSENFQARFRALASRAGITLGTPKGTDAEDFWLHHLFLNLIENNSDQLFAAEKNKGGIILQVCAASATFCARLERKALEASVQINRQDSKRREAERSDPEVAKRRSLLWSNPSIRANELCEILDRERVPVPHRWQGAGFNDWKRAFKNPKYRSRIHVLFSKDRESR